MGQARGSVYGEQHSTLVLTVLRRILSAKEGIVSWCMGSNTVHMFLQF